MKLAQPLNPLEVSVNLPSAETNLVGGFNLFEKYYPPGNFSYPTLGKETASSKLTFQGTC